MKFKKFLGSVVCCIIVIGVMLCGALGIYMIRHEYKVEKIEKKISNDITEMVYSTSGVIEENITTMAIATSVQSTSIFDEETTLLYANAGGELDNGDFKDTEEEDESLEIDNVSIVDREEKVTEAATTVKEMGEVVTDEKLRAALIKLGYDPDNYVASELSFSEKKELVRLAYGEVASSSEENMQESVDYSQRTLEYDGPELPKPMG